MYPAAREGPRRWGRLAEALRAPPSSRVAATGCCAHTQNGWVQVATVLGRLSAPLVKRAPARFGAPPRLIAERSERPRKMTRKVWARSGLLARWGGHLLGIPFHRAAQTLFKGGVAAEAEQGLGPAHVQLAARLAVRLAGVPDQPALKAGDPRNGDHQVADANLEGAAQVHGVAVVVALGRQQNALGRVLGIQKLAGRRAVAPHHDLVIAARP